jgi:hypothetical protein
LPERGTDRTTGVAIDLVGDELRFATGYLADFMSDTWRGLWIADRTPGYAISSPAANVIRVTGDGQATDIVLDPATWLPLRHVPVSSADSARVAPVEIHFTEWTEVSGLRFPRQRTDYRNGAKIREGVYDEIKVNSGLINRQGSIQMQVAPWLRSKRGDSDVMAEHSLLGSPAPATL